MSRLLSAKEEPNFGTVTRKEMLLETTCKHMPDSLKYCFYSTNRLNSCLQNVPKLQTLCFFPALNPPSYSHESKQFDLLKHN